MSETEMQIAFDRISDALFVQIDEVGKQVDHSPEFYSLVEEWFGPAVATEYNDWEEREANACTSLTHAPESRDA